MSGKHDLLLGKVTRLVECLELLIPKIDELLNRASRPASHKAPPPDITLLSENQRRVCESIEKISGVDSIAMLKVEKLLNELKGEKISEALGRFIGNLFRDRGWGVRCSCGEIGRPMWQRNVRCAENGLLVLTHKAGSKQQIHDTTTTVRGFTIVSRPDRRKQRPERE